MTAEPAAQCPVAATVYGVIPARYGSTRFPGKPLTRLADKPMVQWVYERACQAKRLSRVLIATDNDRIYRTAQLFGAEVLMTSTTHPSGTDRIAEVARNLPHVPVFVNIQGDEPLIEPAAIDSVVEHLLLDETAQISTLVAPCDEDDWKNPNVVKTVLDVHGHALYFSRAPIPYRRNADGAPPWRHIGLYAYRSEFLTTFAQTDPTPLERTESLEQLRALELGYRIVCGVTRHESIAIDTPEDVLRMEALLRALE